MKTLLFTLITLSSLSAFAKADCSIYSNGPVTEKLEKVLKKKGYELTKNQKSATFELDYDQSDVEESYLLVSPPNYVRVVRKKIGTYTAFNILENGKHFAFAYGEASSILFRSENYEPTKRNKARSYKKAVRDLKRNLEDCRY
jgi:hypothetical protein